MNMANWHSLSNDKSLKRDLNAKSFNKLCKSWSNCGDILSVSVATQKVDVNSVLGESSKEASSSTISTKASSDDDSNKETCSSIISPILTEGCTKNLWQILCY